MLMKKHELYHSKNVPDILGQRGGIADCGVRGCGVEQITMFLGLLLTVVVGTAPLRFSPVEGGGCDTSKKSA